MGLAEMASLAVRMPVLTRNQYGRPLLFLDPTARPWRPPGRDRPIMIFGEHVEEIVGDNGLRWDVRLPRNPATGLPATNHPTYFALWATNGSGPGTEHGDLRAAIGDPFSPRNIALSIPYMRSRMDREIDMILASGLDRFDLSQVAGSYAFGVICHILGIEEDEFPGFADELLRSLKVSDVTRIPEQPELNAGLLRMIEHHRRTPGPGTLADLLQKQQQGCPIAGHNITDEQIMGYLFSVLAAAYANGEAIICNTTNLLLRHRTAPNRLLIDDAYDNLDDSQFIERVRNETLRYDTPFGAVIGRAVQDTPIGHGIIAPPGQLVLAWISARNRSLAVCPRGDGHIYDPYRDPAPHHVSYGLGTHYCLGANLASALHDTAVQALLERLPGLRISGRVRYGSGFLKYVQEMELGFDRDAARRPG
jgi:cytochrome P450